MISDRQSELESRSRGDDVSLGLTLRQFINNRVLHRQPISVFDPRYLVSKIVQKQSKYKVKSLENRSTPTYSPNA